MDIRPPKKPTTNRPAVRPISSQQPSRPSASQQRPQSARPVTAYRPTVQTVESQVNQVKPTVPELPSEEPVKKEKPVNKHRKLKIFLIIAAVFATLAAVVVGVCLWSVGPRDDSAQIRGFIIKSGETPAQIGARLEEQKFIKSQLAFNIYTRLTGTRDKLKAGAYELSSNMSVGRIVDLLVEGRDEVYSITIPPGRTLKQLADPAIKNSFAAQGFSKKDIEAAFSSSYVSPLLAGKPRDASLEGYVFPETFQVRTTDSLSDAIQRSMDELYRRIEKDSLQAKFSEHGLSLRDAITLASIVEKESTDAAIQPQIAQVFLTRLKSGISLGSDVTFMYAARQMGVTATPDLDSPYNTRIHTGLPPGPISNFNYSALHAVAFPANTDYLYFVAGDDGVVYFSNSNAEHESLVQQHCKTLCGYEQ